MLVSIEITTRNYSFKVQQEKKEQITHKKSELQSCKNEDFLRFLKCYSFIKAKSLMNPCVWIFFFLVRIIFRPNYTQFFLSPTITGIEILEYFSSRWLELAENWSVLLSVGHWGEGVDACHELEIITLTHTGSRNRKHLATLRWILEIFIFERLSECRRSINSNPCSTLP